MGPDAQADILGIHFQNKDIHISKALIYYEET